jgi:hypothetical protein
VTADDRKKRTKGNVRQVKKRIEFYSLVDSKGALAVTLDVAIPSRRRYSICAMLFSDSHPTTSENALFE